MANSYRYVFSWIDEDGNKLNKTITALEEMTEQTTALKAAAGKVLTTVAEEQPFNTRISSYDSVYYKATKYTPIA